MFCFILDKYINVLWSAIQWCKKLIVTDSVLFWWRLWWTSFSITSPNQIMKNIRDKIRVQIEEWVGISCHESIFFPLKVRLNATFNLFTWQYCRWGKIIYIYIWPMGLLLVHLIYCLLWITAPFNKWLWWQVTTSLIIDLSNVSTLYPCSDIAHLVSKQ